MPDEIRNFVVGELDTNCYAYISGGEALVVDPGANGSRIATALSDVRVISIVATHCHHDHVCGIAALAKATGAPWSIGFFDAEAATNALARSVHATPQSIAEGELADPRAADRKLINEDVIDVGSAHFRVVETPGHTPGGIILMGGGSADGIAFVGDTLFAGSCGRTDLAGGDPQVMATTLAMLRDTIPPKTTLFCGHGPATTMAQELKYNPYLQ